MARHFDIIVIGLGAMGSAAHYQLARRGKKVLGIDRFTPPHNLGSSHGDTRITRLAIGEGDFYTPFAVRSHEIWKEMGDLYDWPDMFFVRTGGLIMASPSDRYSLHGSKDFIGETKRAAEKYNIEHEILEREEIRKRFPQFNRVGDVIGYYEPTAGYLRPENCVRGNLVLAKENGAEILTGRKVTDVIPCADKTAVEVSGGSFIANEGIIISAGAWVKEFIPLKYHHLFTINRQILFWFDILSNFNYFLPKNFPIFIWQKNNGFIYGFPAIDGRDGGVKIASESTNSIDPDNFNRNVSLREIKQMHRDHIQGYFPDLSPACLKAITCIYTSTPDHRFVIDRLEDHPQVIIASPCSGHGFKHSAAIGEALAEMAIHQSTTLDISPFGLKRFEV